MNTRTAIGAIVLSVLFLNIARCSNNTGYTNPENPTSAQQAAQWWLRQALKGIGAMKDPLDKIYGLCEIGKEQALCGYKASALKTYRDALDIVKNSKQPLRRLEGSTAGSTDTGKDSGPDQSYAYNIIAVSQASAGLHKEAHKTAKKISRSKRRYVYFRILVAEADAGYFEQAKQTAAELKNYKNLDSSYSPTYSPIAIAQARAGQYQQAVDTVLEEKSDTATLYKIASVAIEFGHFNEAIKIIEKMKPVGTKTLALYGYYNVKKSPSLFLCYYKKGGRVSPRAAKAMVLAEIAVAQAKAGKKVKAAKTLALAKGKMKRTKEYAPYNDVLFYIAKAEALLGNKEVAAEIFDEIKGGHISVCNIAVAQVEVGMPDAAEKTFKNAIKATAHIPFITPENAERMRRNFETSRGAVLGQIAIFQARAGLFEQAIKTAKKIPAEYMGGRMMPMSSYPLRMIALYAAKAGRFDLADKILHPKSRARAAVGIMAAEAGRFDLAKKMCKTDYGLCEIGHIQIRAGHIKEARQTFAAIKTQGEFGSGYVVFNMRISNQKIGRGWGLMGAEADMRTEKVWRLPYFCTGVAGGITERDKQAKEKAAN